MKTQLELDKNGIITDQCWFDFKREAYVTDATWQATEQRCEWVYATTEEKLRMLCVELFLAKARLTEVAVTNMRLGTPPALSNTNIESEK